MLNKITMLVFEVIDEINEDATRSDKIIKSLDTVLVGRESSIDSLTLLEIIVGLERKISDELNKHIIIVSDRAFSSFKSPFSTVSNLVYFVT